MKRCVLVFAAVTLIAAIGLAHAESTPATGNELRLEELWISVTDLDEAARFYSEHLSWRVVTREPEYVTLHNGQLGLVMVSAAAPVRHTRYSVKTMFNFYVDDLRAKRESFRHAGVRLLDDKIYEAAVGDWFAFFDPSGNLHLMIEPGAGHPVPPARGSTPIFNLEVDCPNTEVALAFYGDVLGFPPTTDDFAPVYPMALRGPAQFVLEITGQGRSPCLPGQSACASFAFTAADVTLARERLAALGVEFLTEGFDTVAGRKLAWFRDPFGSVHALIQR